MATRLAGQARAGAASYDRLGSLCLILTGISGFLYSISFVVLTKAAPALSDYTNSLFLLLTGLLSLGGLVTIYNHLRQVEAGYALLALLLGIISAFGALVHGGYDLANAIHPPTANNSDLPNPVDPRGLLAFGLAGLAALVIGGLLARSHRFPASLAYLSYLLGTLLLVIYLGRLIVLEASNPLLLIPAALTGFIVSPAWYLWLGLSLGREARG